jgi:diacylglycerol kinase family enzyme
MLIINPCATTTSGRGADRVVSELGSRFTLRIAQTRYRGHARELAASAAAERYDLIVTFGGDGTINEVVNGVMTWTDPSRDTDTRPAIAPVPGGGGNVFARTLGLPHDPASAVRRILSAADAGTRRTIGLGMAGDRYFTSSAGLGIDAEVVAEVDRRRADGRRASTLLYMRTALRRFYKGTDRRRPALTIRVPGQPPVDGLFMGVVTNSSPWTYLGGLPLRSAPTHDLSSGLDLFAMRRMSTLTTLTALRQMMLHANSSPPSGRDLVTATTLTALTFCADHPVAFHIDGEYLGQTEQVTFGYKPEALNIVA